MPRQPKKPAPRSRLASEASLKASIVKYLLSIGVLAWRNPASLYGRSGRPDIEGVLPRGRALFIEAKKPGKYKDPYQGLTPAQDAWAVNLIKSGALYLCTDDLQTVKNQVFCLTEAYKL